MRRLPWERLIAYRKGERLLYGRPGEEQCIGRSLSEPMVRSLPRADLRVDIVGQHVPTEAPPMSGQVRLWIGGACVKPVLRRAAMPRFSAAEGGVRSWPEMLTELRMTKRLEETRAAPRVRCTWCDHLGGTVTVWRYRDNPFTDSYFTCENPQCDGFMSGPVLSE